MSAKLLYSLSDDKNNLQKQIGCMNGFLHLFDRHHSITSPTNNTRLSPGESSQKGREPNNASKRSKGKHKKVIKETQGNPIEPSRLSFSSSSSSTTFSDQSPFDCRLNQPQSSPNTSHKSHKNHITSDLTQTPRLGSPRCGAVNESFRSISSNQSAPVTPRRQKDAPRLSYDGRETSASSLRLGDLPRLSLDSRQQTLKKSEDLLLTDLQRERQNSRLQKLPEEPGSYRPLSNVVAKLMGLEALPDSDSLSRSSSTIDESKLNRVLNSPRNNSRDSLSVYGEIEKRLADIDFKKSGKDLRALKQILEAMHKEKAKVMETKTEKYSSVRASQTCNMNTGYIKQGPRKTNSPTSKVSTFSEDFKSTTEIKPAVRVSRKAAAPVVRDLSPSGLHRLKMGQPADNSQVSVVKKTTKDPTPRIHHSQGHSRKSHCTTPRPIRTSKAPQHKTKMNITSLPKIPQTVNTEIYSHNPATKLGSKNKNHNHQSTQSSSQNRKLRQKSYISKDTDDQSSEFSASSACPSQQRNTNSLLSESNSSLVSEIDTEVTSTNQSGMEYATLQQVRDKRNSEGIPNEGSFKELAIAIQEQPSPVSVLDANFFEDECPSPVKKRPTAFRDNEAEWKDIRLTYSPYSMRPSFSYENDYQNLEKYKQSTQTLGKLNTNQDGNINSPRALHKEVNLQKEYVSEILLASGFLDDPNFTDGYHRVHQLKEAINPNLFFVLEQSKGSKFLSDKKCSTNEKHRRRLTFDVVNEILSRKLSSTCLGSQTLRPSGQQLVKEMIKEIDNLQANNSNHSLDDEDDFLTNIIGKDLTHSSANWTDFGSEISGLVLDIERLIFKDLIVELVHERAA